MHLQIRSDSPTGFRSPARRKTNKTVIEAEKGRKRREEDIAGIRRIRREETLFEKRGGIHTNQSCDWLVEDVQHLWSEDPDEQLEAAVNMGCLLTLEDPPIDEVVMTGAISRFVEFLSMEDAPQLQMEAVSILTNISSGESRHTGYVVGNGAIPSLVKLLSSSDDDDIREQTVGALANIAGDSPRYRDLILHHGALLPLLSQLQPHSRLSMLRHATWCLSNLLRGKPPVNLEQVRLALPVLQNLIHSKDEKVVKNTCWALSYLADGTFEHIQAVIELGVCPKLVELLLYPSDTVIIPALLTLENISTGDDVQTQVVIDNRLLPYLHQLLTQEDNKEISNLRRIFREVCWTISNITAGTESQVQAVIDADIIPFLVEIIHNAEFEIMKAATWAIFNVTCRGSQDNIRFLADQGCIEALCQLLDNPETKLLLICLQGLENILRVGKADQEKGLNDGVNIFVERVNNCEGIYENLYNLLTDDDCDVKDRASTLCRRLRAGNDVKDMD